MKTSRMDKLFHIGTSLNCRNDHETNTLEEPRRGIEDVGKNLADKALTLNEVLTHFLGGHNSDGVDVANDAPDGDCDTDNDKKDVHRKFPFSLFYLNNG